MRKWIVAACAVLETLNVTMVDRRAGRRVRGRARDDQRAKKKKKDSGAAKWEELIERCRYHEEKLELVLRLIDNESLSPEDVDQIKDQLDYLLEVMVDGNTDEVDGIDDDSIYEELGLDDLGKTTSRRRGGKAAPKEEPKAPDAKETKKSKKELEKEEKEREKEREKEKKKEKEKVTTTELPSINAAAKKAPRQRWSPRSPPRRRRRRSRCRTPTLVQMKDSNRGRRSRRRRRRRYLPGSRRSH